MKRFEAIPHYQLNKNADSYFYKQRINLFIQKNDTNHHPHRHPGLYQIGEGYYWTGKNIEK